MYKTNNNRQLELTDFNQPIGLTMDPNNRWVRLAAMIPWKKYEHKYARLFIGSKVGNVAKPFRMALGSLIIQQKLGFSDRELVEEITEKMSNYMWDSKQLSRLEEYQSLVSQQVPGGVDYIPAFTYGEICSQMGIEP